MRKTLIVTALLTAVVYLTPYQALCGEPQSLTDDAILVAQAGDDDTVLRKPTRSSKSGDSLGMIGGGLGVSTWLTQGTVHMPLGFDAMIRAYKEVHVSLGYKFWQGRNTLGSGLIEERQAQKMTFGVDYELTKFIDVSKKLGTFGGVGVSYNVVHAAGGYLEGSDIRDAVGVYLRPLGRYEIADNICAYGYLELGYVPFNETYDLKVGKVDVSSLHYAEFFGGVGYLF